MTGGPADGRAGTTVAELLRRGAYRLSDADLDDPTREALVVWAAQRSVSPGNAWFDRHAHCPDDIAREYLASIERRAAGVPTAYCAGTAAFRHIELSVDERVLIPRPETEGLVALVLEYFLEMRTGPTVNPSARLPVVADIGTGSGCIAISLATEGRFGRVIATDQSADALEVARANWTRYAESAATCVEFLMGDLLGPLVDPVDGIVSNPPYLTGPEWSALGADVRDHEPRAALASGEDGMTHTRRLLEEAPSALREGGLLALEVDSRRAARVASLAIALRWNNVRVVDDLFGRPRYVLAHKEST